MEGPNNTNDGAAPTVINADSSDQDVRHNPAAATSTPAATTSTASMSTSASQGTIPFTWAVESTGRYARLGFKKHEYDLPFGSKDVLGDIDKYFRLSLSGSEQSIPTHSKLEIIPVLPETVRSAKTVKEFVQNRGWYQIKVLSNKESLNMAMEEELDGLTDKEVALVLEAVKKAKNSLLASPIDDNKDKDDDDDNDEDDDDNNEQPSTKKGSDDVIEQEKEKVRQYYQKLLQARDKLLEKNQDKMDEMEETIEKLTKELEELKAGASKSS